MSKYLIYFNQQWVGDHSSEWFQSRGPLARQVVEEMKEARVLVFAGGLVEEIQSAFGSDENGVVGGPITTDGQFIGGMTIVEVLNEEDAKSWGGQDRRCMWVATGDSKIQRLKV